MNEPLKVGAWPEHDLRRAFVSGAAWWEEYLAGGTMWPADRDRAESEANRRFAKAPTLVAVPTVEALARYISEWDTRECKARFLTCVLDEREIASLARAVHDLLTTGEPHD